MSQNFAPAALKITTTGNSPLTTPAPAGSHKKSKYLQIMLLPPFLLKTPPYSPRSGTEASGLSDRVAGPLVRDRARALRALGTELSRRFREAQVGVVRPGLTLEGGTVVLTDNYLKVPVAPGCAGNERVRVRITSAEPLMGELVA